MADANSQPSRRWGIQLLLIAVASGAGFVASNQRWIDIAHWPVIGRLMPASTGTRDNPAVSRGGAPAPPPPYEEDLEFPVELANAQFEPQIEGESDEDSELGLATIAGRDHEVMTAVHEEDASESADDPLEDQPPRKLAAHSDDDSQKSPARLQRKQTPAKQVSRAPVADERTSAQSGPALMELAEIETLFDEGEYVAAQRELSRWYFARPKERSSFQSKLNRMSQALYFAPQPHYYEPYVVESGDQMRTIGKKYQLSWEYLAKLNRVAPAKIRQGQKLKVLPGPFGVVVSLSRFELTVHLDGSYVKSYRVGIGKDDSSPMGTFTVKNKQVDPTYYGPDEVIRNDDPENPLGERWIDIGDSYGIHGTNEPASIGKAESRGCIRMKNEDVEEVYDFLVIGSQVKIER